MVDQCKYMIAFKLPEVKELPSFSMDGRDDRRSALIIAIPRQRPFELSKSIGKLSKSARPGAPLDSRLPGYGRYVQVGQELLEHEG
ncbi:MAG: hypothetical protein FJ295_21700 [Planctomycetes bacterium]|nr:hypothetical protein [Planctomycetota bacterium]